MKKLLMFVLFASLGAAASAYGDAKSDMMPALNEAKAGVSSVLAGIDRDLSGAAKKLSGMDLKSAEARNILLSLCKGKKYVYDCGIVDLSGHLSVIEPKSAKMNEGKDISFRPQVKALFKLKRPVMSKIFAAYDGVDYIDYEYPIISDKGKFLGGLSLLVRHDELLKSVIAPIVKGKKYAMWVMQKDGVIVYDQDPNQINKDILTDPMFNSFDSLKEFSKAMAGMRIGSGGYAFYRPGDKDKKIVEKAAVWDTVGLYGTEWRLVAIMIEK